MRNWELLAKSRSAKEEFSVEEIVKTLLKNRGLKTKREQNDFLTPKDPEKITIADVGIGKTATQKATKRIKKALVDKEGVVVYGDYDADGICATAILWEALYGLGLDVMPYIPERFSEGYGLKGESIKKIKEENPGVSLIITVDNGIVAQEAVGVAKKLGIDVIITDHHAKAKSVPEAFAIIHTTKVGGAAIAWFFARETLKALKDKDWRKKIGSSLELAAIGTVSDQISLLGPNRSLVKYGLAALAKTKRVGLKALFEEAAIDKDGIGIYHVNFLIAPRLNAMGRMQHAIDSLRLLCTTDATRARNLAALLGKTNAERQKVVDQVVAHAKDAVGFTDSAGVIVVGDKSYHEGVVGLAASKLVEEFYRPAIVFSIGKETSKASARSISGFNIIQAIRKVENMLLDAGGHPMAAGLSIKTKKLGQFSEKINEVSKPLLTDDVLTRSLKVDLEIGVGQITAKLFKELKKFEPTGIGNPRPTFMTEGVEVLEARAVGKSYDHLKLRLASQPVIFDAIAFNRGSLAESLADKALVNVVYNIEENSWNGRKSIELRVKDIKLA